MVKELLYTETNTPGVYKLIEVSLSKKTYKIVENISEEEANKLNADFVCAEIFEAIVIGLNAKAYSQN